MQTPVQQLIQQGIAAGGLGDKQQAVTYLQSAVDQDNSQAEAWYWLGVFAEDKNKQEESLKRALSLRPDDSRALKLLAELQTLHASAPAKPSVDVASVGDLLNAPAPAAKRPEELDDPFIALADPKPPTSPAAPAPIKSTRTTTTRAAVAPAAKAITQPMKTVAPKPQKIKRDTEASWLSLWLNALRFNSQNSVERYRPAATSGQASLTAMVSYLIAVVGTGLLLLMVMWASNGASFDGAERQRGFLILLVGGTLFCALFMLATYFASYATAYLARIHYGSQVSGDEHFALSSMSFAPVSILTGLVVIATVLLTRFSNDIMWNYYDYMQDGVSSSTSAFLYAVASTLSITIFMTWLVYTVYLVGQYIFSVVAIHRVKTLPGVVLTLVFIGVQLLVIFWILPFMLGIVAIIPS